MNTRSGVLILLGCIALATAGASAKNIPLAERIKFKKGQHMVSLTGSLANEDLKGYLLGGEADERIALHLMSSDSTASFVLSEAGTGTAKEIELARGTDWEGTLPELADYSIIVSGENKNTTYTLRVTVTPPSS